MPTHDEHVPHGHEPEKIDISAGYERSDANVTGIVVFITALGIFVGGDGDALLRHRQGDQRVPHEQAKTGPTASGPRRWTFASSATCRRIPRCRTRLRRLTQTFPTPRVQMDDGNQDIADLHAREDLLLNNYTWVDQSKGTVRIPDRARHGVDCATGIAGGAAGADAAADDRRQQANGDHAADRWICAAPALSRKRRRPRPSRRSRRNRSRTRNLAFSGHLPETHCSKRMKFRE